MKRGKDRESHQPSHGVDDIFNSDEEEEAQQYARPGQRRVMRDEMDDFIEEDTFSDDEAQRERDDLEVAPASRVNKTGLIPTDTSGLDENAL